MLHVSAFCPAGISSFFQAVTTKSAPATMDEACRIGARGGGFILEKGVHTQITIEPAKTNQIEVIINGRKAPEAKVTQEVCQLLLQTIEAQYRLHVDHKVEIPIGAGYGASAAGAVSTAMALNRALELNLTLNRIGQFAHFAEIRCATGLGSVSGVIRGGLILILEPGAPGYDRVDWIPLDPAYRIVTGSFAPISKADILFSEKALWSVNREGQRVLEQVQQKPTPAHFMHLCLGFAKKVGFLTPRVANVLERVQDAGAIGATQNMIGEAFHALVHADSVDSVVKSVEHLFPPNSILVSEVSSVEPRYT
ncbi:MAG: pantoate kinase [Promethearchaeota archaeon]